MCGIAGFVYFQRINPSFDSSAVLCQMVRSLKHRGPDSEGFYENPGIGMGIRRLRVIDLATGDQPISNEDETLWIVFNGEIYNYRSLREELKKKGYLFRTATDTEVILKLYEEKGPDCVHHLNGMYAFAIYDARRKSLFLARDPLGIKPLFYYRDQEKLLFGSEIKSLLVFPGISLILDAEALSHFLSLNYLPSPWTLFKGIRQLEGGYWLWIKDGEVRMERFWNPLLVSPASLSEEEVLRETKRLLQESVENQLVADVPVGAFVSGGLDSSALVALVKEVHEAPIETFSLGFQESSYDETFYAQKVARYFGTRHHEVTLRFSDLPPLLEKFVFQLDQPLADPAALALYKLSELTRQFVTVALSGDGSDEIFVGYPTYHANRYLQWFRSLPRFLRERLIAPIVKQLPASGEKFSFDYRAKKFLEGSRFFRRKAHFWWRTIFSDDEKKRILAPPFARIPEGIDSFEVYRRHFADSKQLDFTNQCLYADLRVWLAGNNLPKVDSMSMAHSLEARVPYLDQPLVDFLMRVPPSIKFKKNQTKYLLKKIMKNLLPEEVVRRKKAGWHVPFALWFRYGLKDFLTERFQHAPRRFYEVFQKKEVERLLGEHFRGENNNSFKIWGLLVLEEWFRVYGSRLEVCDFVEAQA